MCHRATYSVFIRSPMKQDAYDEVKTQNCILTQHCLRYRATYSIFIYSPITQDIHDHWSP